jgi:hypothetical protein
MELQSTKRVQTKYNDSISSIQSSIYGTCLGLKTNISAIRRGTRYSITKNRFPCSVMELEQYIGK